MEYDLVPYDGNPFANFGTTGPQEPSALGDTVAGVGKGLYNGLEDTARRSIQSADRYAKTGDVNLYDPAPVMGGSLYTLGTARFTPAKTSPAVGLLDDAVAVAPKTERERPATPTFTPETHDLVPVEGNPFVEASGDTPVDLSTLGVPSWLDRATEQTRKDKAAFERGGVKGLLSQDTDEAQQLAGGFGGNIRNLPAGVSKGVIPFGLRAVNENRLEYGGQPYAKENATNRIIQDVATGKVPEADLSPEAKTQILLRYFKYKQAQEPTPQPPTAAQRMADRVEENAYQRYHAAEEARANGTWRQMTVEHPELDRRGEPVDPNAPYRVLDTETGKLVGEAKSYEDAHEIAELASIGRNFKLPDEPRQVMTKVPDIRGMEVNKAIAIARDEPHLIPKEGGGFVGGPPSVKTYADLQILRQKIDKRIAANPEGGTWYDRYRAAVKEVTGNNPIDNDWMTKQHAQWSAGVSPESETQFTLKENNASLAGMPVKSARPAQHAAHEAAIIAEDPNKYQLGQKTGEYARHNNPDQAGPPGATGVNDFRYQEEFGYPKVVGGGLTSSTIHKFMDYETALAVERANKANLGGRSNWTGEQTQASPWVTQKAEALMEQRGIPFEEAYPEANKQIGDFFDKHTAFATHEAQPGETTGHLPGSVKATQEERNAFAADPRSSWDNPVTGRDELYSGLRIPGTGVAMRVRPSVPMQGAYMNQYNPGTTARPLIAFDSGPTKSVPPADRALLDAGEATRAYVDAQDMGGWHKPWMGGQAKDSNSLFIPREGKLSPEQIPALEAAGAPHGLPHAVDTGRGVTMTSFDPDIALPKDVGKSLKGGLSQAVEQVLGPSDINRVKINSNAYENTNFANAWKAGGGAATRQMLDRVTKTPQMRAAFNNNAAIPQAALQRLERDQEWASKWGAPREDIQNARRIIGQGKGWVDRLEAALKAGAILPATAVAVMGTSVLYGHQVRGSSDQY